MFSSRCMFATCNIFSRAIVWQLATVTGFPALSANNTFFSAVAKRNKKQNKPPSILYLFVIQEDYSTENILTLQEN